MSGLARRPLKAGSAFARTLDRSFRGAKTVQRIEYAANEKINSHDTCPSSCGLCVRLELKHAKPLCTQEEPTPDRAHRRVFSADLRLFFSVTRSGRFPNARLQPLGTPRLPAPDRHDWSTVLHPQAVEVPNVPCQGRGRYLSVECIQIGRASCRERVS